MKRKQRLYNSIKQILLDSFSCLSIKEFEAYDKEMKKLNHQFRNKNNTTNVLSFQNDDISLMQTKNIGDIAISLEYVKREAKEEGKFFEDHMIHMLAHGVYHILGYDHENDEMAATMESKEINILNKININNPY